MENKESKPVFITTIKLDKLRKEIKKAEPYLGLNGLFFRSIKDKILEIYSKEEFEQAYIECDINSDFVDVIQKIHEEKVAEKRITVAKVSVNNYLKQ